MFRVDPTCCLWSSFFCQITAQSSCSSLSFLLPKILLQLLNYELASSSSTGSPSPPQPFRPCMRPTTNSNSKSLCGCDTPISLCCEVVYYSCEVAYHYTWELLIAAMKLPTVPTKLSTSFVKLPTAVADLPTFACTEVECSCEIAYL